MAVEMAARGLGARLVLVSPFASIAEMAAGMLPLVSGRGRSRPVPQQARRHPRGTRDRSRDRFERPRARHAGRFLVTPLLSLMPHLSLVFLIGACWPTLWMILVQLGVRTAVSMFFGAGVAVGQEVGTWVVTVTSRIATGVGNMMIDYFNMFDFDLHGLIADQLPDEYEPDDVLPTALSSSIYLTILAALGCVGRSLYYW